MPCTGCVVVPPRRLSGNIIQSANGPTKPIHPGAELLARVTARSTDSRPAALRFPVSGLALLVRVTEVPTLRGRQEGSRNPRPAPVAAAPSGTAPTGRSLDSSVSPWPGI